MVIVPTAPDFMCASTGTCSRYIVDIYISPFVDFQFAVYSVIPEAKNCLMEFVGRLDFCSPEWAIIL